MDSALPSCPRDSGRVCPLRPKIAETAFGDQCFRQTVRPLSDTDKCAPLKRKLVDISTQAPVLFCPAARMYVADPLMLASLAHAPAFLTSRC